MAKPRTITKDDLALARHCAAKYGDSRDDDLESAAMLGLLEAARTWNGKGDWRGWLYSKATSRVIDQLRRREARPELTMDPYEIPTHADLFPVERADGDNVVTFTLTVDTSKFRAALDALAALDPIARDRVLAGEPDRRSPKQREALAALKALPAADAPRTA